MAPCESRPRLSLAGNPLGPRPALPPGLGDSCRRIKYLKLGDTGLTGLPPALLGLRDLRHLGPSNRCWVLHTA